ncbi:hypothetical protein KBC75_04420 [Candidatus Shapirobacteria bacterium]|nr:hypothetical protein [Candidatus Shapirobacteria bacterium]
MKARFGFKEFVTVLSTMALVACTVEGGSANTAQVGNFNRDDVKILPSDSPDVQKSKQQISAQLDVLVDNCKKVDATAHDETLAYVVKADGSRLQFGFCKVGDDYVMLDSYSDDEVSQSVQKLIVVRENAEGISYGYYDDDNSFKGVYLIDKKLGIEYVIDDGGEISIVAEKEKSVFAGIFHSGKVIVGEAAPALTDTPPAPTATITAENGSVIPSTVGVPASRETATPQPTAETSPYTSDNIFRIPTRESDIQTLVEVPNPVTDVDGFTRAMEQALGRFNGILNGDYKGDVVKQGQNGELALSSATNSVVITDDLPVIGSASYNLGNGKQGFLLFVPFENTDGSRFASIVIVDPFQTNLTPKQQRSSVDILNALSVGGGVIQFDRSTDAYIALGYGVDQTITSAMTGDFTKSVYSNYPTDGARYRSLIGGEVSSGGTQSLPIFTFFYSGIK